MSPDRTGDPERDLLAIPRVDAVPPVPMATPLEVWRRAWSTRHTLAAAALIPLLFLASFSILPTRTVVTSGWVLALAGLSLLAGTILASYVPGRREAPGVQAASPCAYSGLVLVPLAGMLLSGGTPELGSALLPLGVLVFAGAQRFVSAVSCSVSR